MWLKITSASLISIAFKDTGRVSSLWAFLSDVCSSLNVGQKSDCIESSQLLK